ncbi:hypothetical protein BJF85_23825 [Saccharomonospora sp. CUA-673]|uniref:hypothetical protein n=1 Tax=Saccharomonospora sp. CUA-673 TaxID=1904969 RepID=UPI00095DC5A8|nr:hypothetical protein [Saccharomonospora sp. CUA-673]OLT41367.1 hypothetical protein BJF85_23825 [Saccharomonospora sp. CUA-673]
MTGFGSVPDELQQTAGRIAETVAQAAGVVWRGPGADYGNAAVQQAWGGFMDEVGAQLRALQSAADEHGGGLIDAARSYVQQEQEGLDVFSGLRAAVEQGPAAPASGGGVAGFGNAGLGGGISSVLDGGAF